MRDYGLVAFILASFPIGLLFPFYALLVYAWVSYMYPHMYTWGFAQYFPSAKLMAIATILGAVLRGDFDLSSLRHPAMKMMLVLLAWFTVTTVFSIYPVDAWPRFKEVAKVIFMALFSSFLLTSRERLRAFIIVIALSLGFYGIKGGLFSLTTGGEMTVGGAGNSVVAGNNATGLALNMCLPLLWYMAQGEKGWLKRLLQFTFLLSVPATMFTYSRASAITLAVILLVLLMRSRRALPFVVVLLIMSLLAVPYIPDRWWNRQQTTLDYDADRSASARIDNWAVCWRITLDHPFFGLGFEFMTNELFAVYAPDYLARYGKAFNTHSIYFAMLATHGFPGFVFFVGMIGLTYKSCFRIKRLSRKNPDLKWCATYCDLVMISLLAFLVNGAFVNMEYFDLPYHLVAVTASLQMICQRVMASESAEIGVAGTLSPVLAV